MARHVMLDLETLGTAPGCAILSIGAVAFDLTAILSEFSIHIDVTSCQEWGLTIDGATVLWWLRQNEAARQALVTATPVSLTEALIEFKIWLTSANHKACLWSKGPSFDAAVLAAAYRTTDRAVPWHFRNERCVRTILDLAGLDLRDLDDAGRLRHDALADAHFQARAVQEAMQRLHNAA